MPEPTIEIDPHVKALTMAIRRAETGGSRDPYNQRGSSGEFGAYQFMPGTWRSWAKEHLGNPDAEMSTENQNRVAYAQVKKLKNQGYNPAQIASIWNSGRPDWEGRQGINSWGVRYDTPTYVRRVSQIYRRFAPVGTPPPRVEGGKPPKPRDVFDEFEQAPLGKVMHVAGTAADAIGKTSAWLAHRNLNPLSMVSLKAPQMSLADITRETGRAAGGVITSGVYSLGTLIQNALSPHRALFQGILEASEDGRKKGEDFWADKFEKGAEAAPLGMVGGGIRALGIGGALGGVARAAVTGADVAMTSSMSYEGAKALYRKDYNAAVEMLAPLAAGMVMGKAVEFGIERGGVATSEVERFRTGFKDGLREAREPTLPEQNLIERRRQAYATALNPHQADVKFFLKKKRNIGRVLDDIGEMALPIGRDPTTKRADTSAAREAVQERLTQQMRIVNDAVRDDPTARVNLEEWHRRTFQNIDEMEDRSPLEKLDMKAHADGEFERLAVAYPEGRATTRDLLLERRSLGNRSINWATATTPDKLNNAAEKQMYHAANDTLSESFKDTPHAGVIMRSNEITSRLMDILTLLNRADGHVILGGRLGAMWHRTMGFLLGSAFGHGIGGIVGEFTGGKVHEYLSDPARAGEYATRINERLRVNMGELDRASSKLISDVSSRRYSIEGIESQPKLLTEGTGAMQMPEFTESTRARIAAEAEAARQGMIERSGTFKSEGALPAASVQPSEGVLVTSRGPLDLHRSAINRDHWGELRGTQRELKGDTFFTNLELLVNGLDPLFRRYPKLRKTTVMFDRKSKALGAFVEAEGARDTNTLILDMGYLAGDRPLQEMRGTILHELQHGVQMVEGREAGGTPSMFLKPEYLKGALLDIQKRTLRPEHRSMVSIADAQGLEKMIEISKRDKPVPPWMIEKYLPEEERFNLYQRLQSEVEARVAGGQPRGKFESSVGLSEGGPPRAASLKDFKRGLKLNPQERELETAAFNRILADEDGTMREYWRRMEAKGRANVVDADEFRNIFTSEGYNGLNGPVFQAPVSYLAKRAFTEGLKNPGEWAILYAGSPGSGKTSATREPTRSLGDVSVIKDGTLSEYKEAKRLIDEIHAAGKKEAVLFVFRDPVEAFRDGVIKRMSLEEKRRVVGTSVVVKAFVGSWETVRRLYTEGFNVKFRDNSLGEGRSKEVTLEEMESRIGKTMDTPKIRNLLNSEAQKAAEEGEITKEELEEFLR